LPHTLKSFVDKQLSQGLYGTRGEYLRELFCKATAVGVQDISQWMGSVEII